MKRLDEWDSASLRWIHDIRESQYRETKGLRVEAWLKPVDPDKAARACRRLGLKVRVGRRPGKTRVRMA